MTRKQRWWVVLAATMILAVLVTGTWCVCHVIARMKHVDLALRAAHGTTNAVKKYVREQKKWPTSWEDLESLSAAPGDADYPLPDDWDETRRYVEINFDLTLDEVAKQQVESFDAIRVEDPVVSCDRLFRSLLEEVRGVLHERGERKGQRQ